MEFSQTKTDEIKQNPKYKQLLAWGLENGVIIKDVDLPAAFGDLTGVVATQNIPANTAIICVPYPLIISQEKCKESILRKVYNENPDMFDENETADAEFNILIFYLYLEKKKGKESFFYPYIEAIQTNNTLIDWTDEELNQIEDKIILEEFQIVKQDLYELWIRAKEIFEKYGAIFGERTPEDKENFYWAAQSVMSRCFGWSLKSTSMIPIADFLNHSNRACTHHVVHKSLELGQPLKQFENTDLEDVHKQYIIKKDKINLSLLDVESNLDKIPKFVDPKIKFILEQKQFLDELHSKDLDNLENISNSDKRALINQINYQKLNHKEELNVWDLGFVTSSDSEDNDSDEEIEEARNKQFEELKVRELKEWKVKQEQQKIESEFKQTPEKKQESIVTVCLNTEKKNQVIIKGLPQYQIELMKQKQQLIHCQEQQEIQQKEQEQESESSEESKWDWLEEYDKDGYFCVTTTEPIKKHEQVTVSYGRRTNRFLLSWYGFALPENKYSSFNFRLWLNSEIAKEKVLNSKQIFDTITINKLIQSDEWETGKIKYKEFNIPITAITKEFRLKKHKLNMDLLMYLRLYLMLYYTTDKNVLITIPVSIDYEIFVMQFCIQLLQYYLRQFSQELFEDNAELQKPISFPRRFAVYINRERKEILINQIMILLDSIIILKRYKETHSLKQSYLSEIHNNVYEKMEILRGIKHYLRSINDFL